MKGGERPCADRSLTPETSDRLHARLPAFARRVDRAKEIVREALAATRNPYVAFSGGKDSTAALHLVAEQRPGVTAAFLDSGAELPDTLAFVERIGREWPVRLEIVRPPAGLLDLLEEYGAYGLPAKAEYRKGDITRRLVHEPMLEFARSRGHDAVFMGLRREENRRRLYMLSRQGVIHRAQYDGLWHVNPLADWKGEDVWAYIASRGLPYNPVYDKTAFQPREWIRVAPWAGGTGRERGRFQWLKFYYPQVFNEFARRFPNVRAW